MSVMIIYFLTVQLQIGGITWCLPALLSPSPSHHIFVQLLLCIRFVVLRCIVRAQLTMYTLCIHGEDAKWHILKNCREMKATLHKIRYIHAVVAFGEREREREWINFRWCARIQMKHLSRLNVQAKGRRQAVYDGKPHYKYAQMMWVYF